MPKEAKLIKIGNSQGVRIPKAMILRYQLDEKLILEETQDGIVIRSKDTKKLGWKETYQAMADSEKREWDDWGDMDIDADSHL
ncbi:MAG: AbrB/MazE/SpoVT family DNA-binding domain-containing protein [Thiothrix sp.]|nr:MAG: AbrB/MazE/SpoVT family DNA-binding domain-containing protein [Thiothrix sp.]